MMGLGLGLGLSRRMKRVLDRILYQLTTQLPPGSTYTGGSAWIPTFTAVGQPYKLVKEQADVPVWPGFRRVTTVSEGARLGPELWSAPAVAGLVDNGDGTYVASNLTATAGLSEVLAVVGAAPRVSARFTIVSVSGGSARARFWNAASPYRATAGTHSSEIVGVASGVAGIDLLAFSGVLGDISFRQVLPTYLDTTTDGTPLHPKDSRGNYLTYPAWATGVAVTAGDYCHHLGYYYKATANDAVNTTAPASAPNWVVQGLYNPYVGLANWPSTTNKCQCDSVPTEVVGAELVVNGGSEAGIIAPFSLARCSAVQSTTQVHTGTYSAKITVTDVSAKQGVRFSTIVGKAYKATSWVYLPSGQTLEKISFKSALGAGKVETTTKDQWVELITQFVADFTYAEVGAEIIGALNDVFYLDDVSIKEVTNAPGTYSYHNGTTFVQNIPGLTLSGDTAAVLSIVSGENVSNVDWGDGTFRDLSDMAPAGKIYKGICPAGAASGFVSVTGTTANTNSHSLFIIGRAGVGTLKVGLTGGAQATTTSTAYRRLSLGNVTPNAGTNTMVVEIPPNAEVYFFVPHLIESSALPLPVIATTAGASTTLAATNTVIPTAGRLTAQNCGIRMLVRPTRAGQTCNLLGIGTTLALTATTVTFGTLVHSYTHGTTPVEIDLYYSTTGRGIRTKPTGGSWSAWTTDGITTGVSMPANMTLGAGLAGSVAVVQTIQSNNPKTALENLL